MDTQSLHNILYLFLDWHPARIKTFTELIWGVVKARTVRIKELAMYVASNGNLDQCKERALLPPLGVPKRIMSILFVF